MTDLKSIEEENSAANTVVGENLDSKMASKAEQKKQGGPSGTALRFASAIPLIILVSWIIFWGPPIGLKIFGLIWVAIVASELMNMSIPESRACRIWGIVATVGLTAVLCWASHIEGALIASLFALAAGAMVFSLIAPNPVEDASRRIAWLLGGPIYVGATLGTTVLLHSKNLGSYWLLFAFFCAFLSDTGAYFAGRAFGKHKLYPLVSPKKTVEGSIGGLVTVAISAVVMHQLVFVDVPLWHLILVGVVAAALGQAGDLLESLIKRSCGVKDSGTIMPGHGGLLDRSDALMFTSATVWLYTTFLLPS